MYESPWEQALQLKWICQRVRLFAEKKVVRLLPPLSTSSSPSSLLSLDLLTNSFLSLVWSAKINKFSHHIYSISTRRWASVSYHFPGKQLLQLNFSEFRVITVFSSLLTTFKTRFTTIFNPFKNIKTVPHRDEPGGEGRSQDPAPQEWWEQCLEARCREDPWRNLWQKWRLSIYLYSPVWMPLEEESISPGQSLVSTALLLPPYLCLHSNSHEPAFTHVSVCMDQKHTNFSIVHTVNPAQVSFTHTFSLRLSSTPLESSKDIRLFPCFHTIMFLVFF